MIARIVEIAGSGRHLAKESGFLEIREGQQQLGRIPLDDILGLVITGPGCTQSSPLLCTLAERNVPVSICGRNYSPVCWILPIAGNGLQSKRMLAQCRASKPRQKSLWRQVVKSKIANQARVLASQGGNDAPLRQLCKKVTSGDRENHEAQAARYYWPRLLGSQFRRDTDGGAVNSLLNYAYTIIRSCVARAVVGAGLHPTLGLHHRGPTNSMCLIDDLMEPFRPVGDLFVKRLHDRGQQQLDRDAKSHLAALATTEFLTDAGAIPLFQIAAHLAVSLAGIYTGEVDKLSLPQFHSDLFFGNSAVSAA